MSKNQKQTITVDVETVENLKTTCKIIMECESMIEFWHMEKIWPINLVMDSLRTCVNILNNILFKKDMEKQND